MKFKPGIQPPAAEPSSGLFFIFDKSRLLIKKTVHRIDIPLSSDLSRHKLALIHRQYIGSIDNRPCYAAETGPGNRLAENLEFIELRSLFTRLEEDLIWVAGRANQLVHWQRTHLYCGACGQPTENKPDERAKICSKCGLINYPRLSPAVIVAVTKENKILLARNKRFQIPFYSVLAGFVEPSETLEQCIEREVKEEVGVSVKHIRYFGSQPWPFPNSLMVAFTAEYAGGDITIDPSEIVNAGWYSKDNLPQVPSTLSIAGQLIEWFCRKPTRNMNPSQDE